MLKKNDKLQVPKKGKTIGLKNDRCNGYMGYYLKTMNPENLIHKAIYWLVNISIVPNYDPNETRIKECIIIETISLKKV